MWTRFCVSEFPVNISTHILRFTAYTVLITNTMNASTKQSTGIHSFIEENGKYVCC